MVKIDIEKICLAVFFVVILYLGPAAILNHKIKHDFPFGYGASDAFQHQVRTEAIKDLGNFKYEVNYISKGLENIIGRYPPAMYHIAVVLSYAAGIETYDAIFFMVMFFSILASITMYFIIKNFNKTIALMSLPLSMLVFYYPISMGFFWGHWPSITAQYFMVLFAWCLMAADLKSSFLIMALTLSAVALAHTSEAVFAFIFLFLYLGLKILFKKLAKNEIKNLILAMILFLIFSFYYLVIFYFAWAKSNPYVFMVNPVWEGNPGFYIGGFGLLLVFLILGIVIGMLKIKEGHVAVIFSLSMLVSGFLNYAGFEVRAFQIRFFWPIYLAVFFGLGAYTLLKLVIKKWNFAYTSAIFLIFVILLSGMVKFPVLKQTKNQLVYSVPFLKNNANPGIMNPYHWQMLKWLGSNTEKNAKIYFFYGDIYNQDAVLRNSKRVHYLVDPEDFINALQQRKIKRYYMTELPGDSGGSLPIRNGFFQIGDISSKQPKDFSFGSKDVCISDYFVFDKVSSNKVLAQYNLLIASEMVKNNTASKIFENEVSVILKNNKVGGECIEEKDF